MMKSSSLRRHFSSKLSWELNTSNLRFMHQLLTMSKQLCAYRVFSICLHSYDQIVYLRHSVLCPIISIECNTIHCRTKHWLLQTTLLTSWRTPSTKQQRPCYLWNSWRWFCAHPLHIVAFAHVATTCRRRWRWYLSEYDHVLFFVLESFQSRLLCFYPQRTRNVSICKARYPEHFLQDLAE